MCSLIRLKVYGWWSSCNLLNSLKLLFKAQKSNWVNRKTVHVHIFFLFQLFPGNSYQKLGDGINAEAIKVAFKEPLSEQQESYMAQVSVLACFKPRQGPTFTVPTSPPKTTTPEETLITGRVSTTEQPTVSSTTEEPVSCDVQGEVYDRCRCRRTCDDVRANRQCSSQAEFVDIYGKSLLDKSTCHCALTSPYLTIS